MVCVYLLPAGERIIVSLVELTTGSSPARRYPMRNPFKKTGDYKEALMIALMGALRWREDINVMHSVTGASKDSINGAVWSV